VLFCRSCNSEVEYHLIPRPDTPHEAEIRCAACDRFIGWKKKEKNEAKRPKQIHSPGSLGIDYCQICLMPKRHLGTNEALEIHHNDDEPENNERINILVVCTSCHKLIHHQRTYRNHQISKKLLIYEEFKNYLDERAIEPSIYDEMIIKMSELLGI